MADVEPTTGQPDARYFTVCSECDWNSQGYSLKSGAQAAASRHNDRVAENPNKQHISVGAEVVEVNADGE